MVHYSGFYANTKNDKYMDPDGYDRIEAIIIFGIYEFRGGFVYPYCNTEIYNLSG